MNSIQKNRRSFVKTAAACSAGVIAAPFINTVARAAEHRMIFGHTFSSASTEFMATGLAEFKARAEELSEGQLTVDIHEAGSLGGQNVLPQKVLTGAIQGCQLSTSNFVHYSEVYSILDMPYLFASNEAFENTIKTEEFLKSDFVSVPGSKGFQVVPGMWANAGFRVLGISKKVDRVVRTPDDLNGLKVRTNGTSIEEVMFKLTSASPVSIAWAEAYQAMQQGAADALSVGLGPLTATKIHETLGSATLYEQNFNSHITILSKRWFDALPDTVQAAIMQAGKDSYELQKAQQAKANANMIEMWQESGIEIVQLTPEEKALWVDTIGHQRSEYDPLKDRFGRDNLETIIKLQG